MSIFSKYRPLVHLLAATLLLPLVCACFSNNYDENCDQIGTPTPETTTPQQYINLSIVVSSGNEGTMRAPLGGEDGDGREVGYEWENKVEGVTFMLYVENDIDTDILAFFKYYSVDELSRKDGGTSYDPTTTSAKQEEVIYTTGDQPLEGLDISKKYKAIVVANLDLTKETKFSNPKVPVKVKDILDYSIPRIHNGSNIGATANIFCMAQESESIVDFANIKTEETPTTNGVNVTYFIEKILVERLAARVDFWTKGATEYKASPAGNGEQSGYVYPVYKKTDPNTPSEDTFILTAITPFNFSSGTEYLTKRLWDSNTDKIEYFADEPQTYNGSNTYVLDPHTKDKTSDTDKISGRRQYMTYELDKILNNDGQWTNQPRMTMKAIKDKNNQWGNTLIEGDDSTPDLIIVCYPKENTLLKDSPLYYYAMGLCIEGDYYKSGEEEPTHCKYYGYLRHEGEKDGIHKIVTKEDLDQTEKGQFPMNFSVVRNNIYRISIDRITQPEEDEDPEITWRIMVKNWDVFTHKTIFM